MSLRDSGAATYPLKGAVGELQSIARSSRAELESVAENFEGLSADTDALLKLAGTIVASVADEAVSSVLPKVQTLGAEAKSFIEGRLDATSGILQTVDAEVGLLLQLSGVTHVQSAIALKINALSVLTKIEAARLGKMGEGFQYLAVELADFSTTLTRDTQELTQYTESRRASIQIAKRTLAGELPRMQDELARIDVLVGQDLALLDTSFVRLSNTPERFRLSVEEIARQIAGVVSAVQSYDITRQQLEHVQSALELIAEKLCVEMTPTDESSKELSRVYAGLTIQTFQLKNIKATLANWTQQIGTCVAGILNVSGSEVTSISPLVLEQEREVSAKIAHIEQLEQEGQSHSDKMRRTLAGLSNLVQLIREHIEKSKVVLKRLQLLSINSMIEASSLAIHSDTILAIARNIVEITAEWNENTAQSWKVMQEILQHVEQTNLIMEAFSEGTAEQLQAAQRETRSALQSLKAVASFAAGQTLGIESAFGMMRSRITQVERIGVMLDRSFARIDAVLNEVEALQRRLEADHPDVSKGYDAEEVEQIFSAAYTTAVERDVLSAALHGTAIPIAQQSFEGNSIELF